jgi:hypothetical protein
MDKQMRELFRIAKLLYQAIAEQDLLLKQSILPSDLREQVLFKGVGAAALL